MDFKRSLHCSFLKDRLCGFCQLCIAMSFWTNNFIFLGFSLIWNERIEVDKLYNSVHFYNSIIANPALFITKLSLRGILSILPYFGYPCCSIGKVSFYQVFIMWLLWRILWVHWKKGPLYPIINIWGSTKDKLQMSFYGVKVFI